MAEEKLVRIVGDHPWKGCLAHVIGKEGPYGMLKCRLKGEDAMDGHEFFVRAGDTEALS